MVPKNNGKFPPSEYKENFVPWPVMAKVNPYAPSYGVSPITLSTANNTSEWQTQQKIDFLPLDEEMRAAAANERLAGSEPVEDVGKLAPTFFAWNLVESPVEISEEPALEYIDPRKSVDTNMTEHQEKFTWESTGEFVKASSTNEYKPNFLGNEVLDSRDWKSEAKVSQEAAASAAASDLYVAGNKHTVDESHPGYFAWSRNEMPPEIRKKNSLFLI